MMVLAPMPKMDTTAKRNCETDADDDGICDVNEIAGCTVEYACNYNADATEADDTTCFYATSGIRLRRQLPAR